MVDSKHLAVYLWCCHQEWMWICPQWWSMEEGLGWAHNHAEAPCLHRQDTPCHYCTLWLGLHTQSTLPAGRMNATLLLPTAKGQKKYRHLLIKEHFSMYGIGCSHIYLHFFWQSIYTMWGVKYDCDMICSVSNNPIELNFIVFYCFYDT